MFGCCLNLTIHRPAGEWSLPVCVCGSGVFSVSSGRGRNLYCLVCVLHGVIYPHFASLSLGTILDLFRSETWVWDIHPQTYAVHCHRTSREGVGESGR